MKHYSNKSAKAIAFADMKKENMKLEYLRQQANVLKIPKLITVLELTAILNASI